MAGSGTHNLVQIEKTSKCSTFLDPASWGEDRWI